MVDPKASRESRRSWIGPASTLAAVLMAHVLVSFGAMSCLSYSYSLGRRIVALHVSLVALIVILGLLGLAAMLQAERVRASRAARFLLALPPATGLFALGVLYAASVVSHANWGANVNYEILASFIKLQIDPANQGILAVSGYAYAVLAAGFVAVYAAYVALATPVIAATVSLFGPERASASGVRRRATLAAIAVFAIAVSAVAVSFTLVDRQGLVRLEPVLAFFLPKVREGPLWEQLAHRGGLRDRDRSERAAYVPSGPFDEKNVVVIIVDALRADHLPIYGYGRETAPFLSGLYESGRLVKVDLALSTCAESNCGILSTLGSKQFNRIVPENFKISDLLRDRGYQVSFILSGDHDWYGLSDFYGESPTFYFSHKDSDSYSLADDRIILEGLGRMPDYAGVPTFFYLHLMSVHATAPKREQFRAFYPIDPTGTRADPVTYTNNYDNSILQADAAIEEIFGRLEEKGYLRDSVVVILSDHGEGLGDHAFGHVFNLYQESIRIPLLFYSDPPLKLANREFATQVDVAPTLLDHLGLPIPASWDGRSLFDPDIKRYSYHQTLSYRPFYAVVYRSDTVVFKFILTPDGREELYDITSDPAETRNIVDVADATLAAHLRSKLGEYLAGH